MEKEKTGMQAKLAELFGEKYLVLLTVIGILLMGVYFYLLPVMCR
jgi:hypothetical protein